MRGYIPWKDWLLFGGLAALSVVGSVIAALTPQEWEPGGIAVLIIVPMAFVGIAITVLVRKYQSRPDYTDKHGIAVWTDDIPEVNNAEKFERLVYVFIRALPEVIKPQFPSGSPERDVTMRKLKDMFMGSRIEWSRNPISLFSRWGWSMKDKAGLQQGKGTLVHWNGSMIGSAMYHEFLHMVDEIILKRYDPTHANRLWWALVPELKRLALQDAEQ
jgi:hypothetical protein